MRLGTRVWLGLLLAWSTWANCAQAQFWPSTQAKIEQTLSNGAVEQRREAAKKLHLLPPSVCRELVARVIDDPDVQVRQSVGQLVLTRRYGEFAPRVQSWLSDADPGIRQLGARVLGLVVIGDEQVGVLARLLSDPVVEVRRTAARVLARAESAAAAPVLLNHLADPSDLVRIAVIEALGVLGSPAATLPLLTSLQDPNALVRRASADALGAIDDTNSQAALSLALLDADGDVRSAAAAAIGNRGMCDAVEELRERVQTDREVAVRVAGVRALVQLGSTSNCQASLRSVIADTLVAGLSDPKQEIRDEVFANLRRFPDFAVPELRACVSAVAPVSMESTNRTMSCALALAEAERSGREVHPPNGIPTQDGLQLVTQAWRNGQISDSELLVVLGAGKYQAGLPMALDMLSSASAQVRNQALQTAYDLLDPSQADGRAVDPLAAFLDTAPSFDETAKAIAVLGHTGAKRALTHLLPFAQEKAPLALRVAAFRALGELKGIMVPFAVVSAALQSESTELREAAARSVREGAWIRLGETLVDMLPQATYDEVQGIANALWGVAPNIRAPQLVAAFAEQVERALPFHQDALLEAFGRIDWAASSRYFARWAAEFPCRGQAKIAEVLALHGQSKPLLLELLRSKCDTVSSNALWALRNFDLDEALFAQILTFVHSERSSLAGNAVAALGYVRSPATSADSVPTARVLDTLCEVVADQRLGAVATSNALTGLRLHARRCSAEGASERALLQHGLGSVRKRAARLLLAGQRALDPASVVFALDKRALRTCARDDVDGDVAATCFAQAETSQPANPHWVTIAIVPEPDGEPLPNAQYILELDSGWIRSGKSDRRGAVLEQVNDASKVALLWL